MVASVFGGKWMDTIMKREAFKSGRISFDEKFIYLPEDRMQENAWLGAVVYPAALIWYGWTVREGVHWLVPVSPGSDWVVFLRSREYEPDRSMFDR